MTTDEGRVWEGRSPESFADAAYNAVAKAEEALGDEPREYEITLRAASTPGGSLSEYIAQARGGD